MAGLGRQLLEHALETARKAGFAEVEIASGESSFSARLTPKPKAKIVKPADVGSGASGSPTSTSASDDGLAVIKAGLVGYFQPGKSPLTVGDKVSKGQVVGIIEALGIASDIESKVEGSVVEILVEPGQPVEFGQIIAKVEA